VVWRPVVVCLPAAPSPYARPVVPPLRLRFLRSVPDASGLPPSDAEVAIVGRSNVGKSSLVNALGHQRDLARVSKTPGRTRMLNVYEVAGGGTLVDLPGYGYAKVSKAERAGWGRAIEAYLREREALRMVAVLVDAEVGPTRLDVDMLEWLRHEELPLAVVATKHDKVRAAKRAKRKKELLAGCGVGPGEVAWVSAAKGTGVDELRAAIAGWLDHDG
jgi:GTP-binding protein